jgi:beta-glucosidase
MTAFPKGFFWGAATASYQVEGGIDNNDWARAARENRVPACGRACDHYNRYESDFDLLVSLGHNAHRISIEWSRIEPREGEFDESELEHYRKVLTALRDRGIEPFVTLWHFTLPEWFVDRGGWAAKDSSRIFARYCNVVVLALKGLCTHWATMNEPMVYSSNGWLRGQWPPFHVRDYFGLLRTRKALAEAHIAAYRLLDATCPSCDVGIVKNNMYFHVSKTPRRFLPRFVWRSIERVMAYQWNHWFLDYIKNDCDSIGINYYFHNEIGFKEKHPKSDMGWDLYPQGLGEVLKQVKKYNKWVFVSECGLADAKDERRAWYTEQCVEAMRSAIKDGVDLRGYMHWSLMDNFEWAKGFWPRFGLIEIDYDTLERRVRPSAYRLKEIIEREQAASA